MLRGKKTILRPVEERDLPLIVRWRNAPETQSSFFSPFLVSEAGQKKWFEKLGEDQTRVLLMIETFEGQTVGMVGYNNIDYRNQSAEGGQFLVDPAERGNGYGEDAIPVMLNYGFDELNLNRVYAITYAKGWVVQLYKSWGFQEEGIMREAVYRRGKFHDTVIVAILRGEWYARRAVLEAKLKNRDPEKVEA